MLFLAGQVGETSHPKFINIITTNFSGGKGLKTGGGVELAGLPASPTSHTPYLILVLYFDLSLTIYTAGNLEILPYPFRNPVNNIPEYNQRSEGHKDLGINFKEL